MPRVENNSANIEAESAPARRRPGRPKGLPKPPGSGRKPGTPNRVTRDVREAAGKHGTKALKALVELLDAPDPKIRTIAAREILDRAYGRPLTPSEVTGKDGAPLIPATEMSNLEALRRVRWIMNKAKRDAAANDEGAAEPPEPRALPAPPEPEPFGVAQAASEHQAESWRLHAEAQEQRRQRPWSDPDYQPPSH